MRRRTFLSCAASFAAFPLLGAGEDPAASLSRIERQTGGRLGVAALDVKRGMWIRYHASERFPMCSTFKMLAVAAILQRVDRGTLALDRRLVLHQNDILDYAPIAKQHLGRGFITVNDACAAAIEWSDNTCANLLLRALGGPHAVTAYARSLGDTVTRLDRNEPSLNTGIPGDPRDTTSPEAMLANLQKIVLGDALSPESRKRLERWMIATKTGTTLLRAGFPSHWIAGDKTGLGGQHNAHQASDTRNDIAFAYPPGRGPILVTAYLTRSQLTPDARDAALRKVGEVIAAAFG